MIPKKFLVPTGFALAALAVLVGLGTWQVQRRMWKLGLIQQIETRTNAPAMLLQQAREIWKRTRDIDHYRITLSGTFAHDKERHLFTVENGAVGWRILTPLHTSDGAIVFVDRGFVPNAFKQGDTRRDGLVKGQVTLTGLARAPEQKGLFTPNSDIKANQWYWRSLSKMAAFAYGAESAGFVPFLLEAQEQHAQGQWPRAGIPRLKFPNNHLDYALTWYGLAIVLLVIYGLFVRQRLLRP